MDKTNYSQIIFQECLICGDGTSDIFNIKLEGKPICIACANAITMQNVKFLINSDARGD